MFAKTAPPIAKPRGRSKPVTGKGRSERKDAVPTDRAGNILDSDASDSSDVEDEGGPGHEAFDQGESPATTVVLVVCVYVHTRSNSTSPPNPQP